MKHNNLVPSVALTVAVTRPKLTVNRKSRFFPQPFARQLARSARINLCTPGGNSLAGRQAVAVLSLV